MTSNARRKDHPQPAAPSRRRPDQAAGSSEQSYRALFEHSLVGLYRTSLEGRILDCNESMARMLGYESRRELMSLPAEKLYHAKADRQAFITKLKASGLLANHELCLRRKTGDTICVLENVSLVAERSGHPPTIHGTMVDITQSKLADKALRESETRYRRLAHKLRRLSRHAQAVREAERARIARELHDELGQSLTALNLDLHWVGARLPSRRSAAAQRIASMCVLVNDTIVALRRICTDLRPTLLDDLGLVAAIGWQAREFQQRTGVRCQAQLPTDSLNLPPEQATTVFRILQESLTNVARHAKASEVRVSLRVRRGALTLTISDNGVGLPREKRLGHGSLGLLGMRERALDWGGKVLLRAESGGGTRVVLRMPMAREAENDP